MLPWVRLWNLKAVSMHKEITSSVLCYLEDIFYNFSYLTWFNQAAGLPLAAWLNSFLPSSTVKKKNHLKLVHYPFFFCWGKERGEMHLQMTNKQFCLKPIISLPGIWISTLHSFCCDPNQIYHPLLLNYTIRTRTTRQYSKPTSQAKAFVITEILILLYWFPTEELNYTFQRKSRTSLLTLWWPVWWKPSWIGKYSFSVSKHT